MTTLSISEAKNVSEINRFFFFYTLIADCYLCGKEMFFRFHVRAFRESLWLICVLHFLLVLRVGYLT